MVVMLVASASGAGEIVVEVGADEVRSAIAENRGIKLEADGIPEGKAVRFRGLLPDTPYDIEVVLRNGTVIAGFSPGWYEEAPAGAGREKAEPLTDDDRAEINDIVSKVPSFYDRSELLQLVGDHDRAVGLVQLIRDRAFHASGEGEVIWRVELYYFKFQAGGWEKVQQQNKVLRRERFRNREQYEDVVNNLRWTPLLGGVRVGKEGSKVIRLTPGGEASGPASKRGG
jgi:hypothetical protein